MTKKKKKTHTDTQAYRHTASQQKHRYRHTDAQDTQAAIFIRPHGKVETHPPTHGQTHTHTQTPLFFLTYTYKMHTHDTHMTHT